MLTEAEWIAALDAAPADATLRLVYADWLDDWGGCGDGWRALAAMGKRPTLNPYGFWSFHCYRRGYKPDWFCEASELPGDVYSAVVRFEGNDTGGSSSYSYWEQPTASECEIRFAIGWMRLPAARRAELLGVPV